MKSESSVKQIVRLTVTLLLICTVVAAVLAGANSITRDKIAAMQAQKTQDAIAEVLPDVTDVRQVPLSGDTGIVSSVYAAGGNYAVEVTPSGFGGELTMMVGIVDGKVSGISVISHSETPNLGAVAAAQNAKGETFRGQFVGQSGELAVSEQIDAISGATITSNAVVSGVNAALRYVENLG